MKKFMLVFIMQCLVLTLVPSQGVYANAPTVTSVVTGTGDVLTNGISTEDGEIKINFSQAMSEASFNKTNVKLQSYTIGTALDAGENGEWSQNGSAWYDFPLTEVLTQNIYWFDISGQVKKLQSNSDTVYIYIRSGSKEHFRVSIQRVIVEQTDVYRIYYSKDDYNTFKNVNVSDIENFNLKIKLDLTAGSNVIELYNNNGLLESGISGTKNVAVDGSETSSSISLFHYTETGTYDRSVYYSSLKAYKGRDHSTATNIANHDFTNLTTLNDLGISLPQEPEGTSFLRIADNVKQNIQEIAYNGVLSGDGLKYTMDVSNIPDGQNCELILSGLKDTSDNEIVSQTIGFIADEDIPSGRKYLNLKSGAGYSLDETPILPISNPQIVAEFDDAVTSLADNSISISEYDTKDIMRIKHNNTAGYLTVGTYAASHVPVSGDIVFEMSFKPICANENASVYFDIQNASTRLIRVSYTNNQLVCGKNTASGATTSGLNKQIESNKWYTIKVVLDPTGTKDTQYYVNGEAWTTATKGTFSTNDLKVVFGHYDVSATPNMDNYVSDMRLNDSQGVLVEKDFGTATGSEIGIETGYVREIIRNQDVNRKYIDFTKALSSDHLFCLINVSSLKENRNHKIIIDKIIDTNGKSIVKKELNFQAKKFFDVSGYPSITGIEGPSGNASHETGFLSSRHSSFNILVSGDIDDSTVEHGVFMDKFEKTDLMHIKQKIAKLDYSNVVENTIDTHSKNKNVVVEANIKPVNVANGGNLYFNIKAGTQKQLTYTSLTENANSYFAFDNAGKTSITDSRFYNLKVIIYNDKAEFYVDNNLKHTLSAGVMSYTNDISVNYGFYCPDNVGALEAYIKDIKVYEEGSEDTPLLNHKMDRNLTSTLLKSTNEYECNIVQDYEISNQPVPISALYDNGKIVITPSVALGYLNTYRVRVTKDIEDTDDNALINPLELEFVSVYSDKLLVEESDISTVENADISGYIGNVVGNFTIRNYTSQGTTATVIIALYDGNALAGINTKDVDIGANQTVTDSVVYEIASGKTLENGKAILYIWENFTNILPVSPISQK